MEGDALTISGAISGGGGLDKQGDGVLTLSGTNSYSGATEIDAGTLQLGDGTNDGSVVGDINLANGSSLVFDNASTLPYSHDISGDGTVTKTGAGTLTLSGTNTYSDGTDATTVAQGDLAFSTASADPGGINSIVIETGGALNVSPTTGPNYYGTWVNSGEIDPTSTGTLAFTDNPGTGSIDMSGWKELSLGVVATVDYTVTDANLPTTAPDNTYRFGGGGGTVTLSGCTLLDVNFNSATPRSVSIQGNVTFAPDEYSYYTGATTIVGGTLTVESVGENISSYGSSAPLFDLGHGTQPGTLVFDAEDLSDHCWFNCVVTGASEIDNNVPTVDSPLRLDGTITINDNSSLTIGGIGNILMGPGDSVTGDGSLIKTGTGMLTLQTNASPPCTLAYQGGTTVKTGDDTLTYPPEVYPGDGVNPGILWLANCRNTEPVVSAGPASGQSSPPGVNLAMDTSAINVNAIDNTGGCEPVGRRGRTDLR